MTKSNLPRPTDSELEILNVLYRRGPSTVREIYHVINKQKPTLYTTVLKMLQIMTEKGLVKRDDQERAHRYEAWLAQEQTQRQLLNDLLKRAFEGSATKLVMQALSSKKTSAEDLAQIRALLDKMERDSK
ncbi:MAG TPA: BlaI/MecI/CopY family transcriptional regulator [Pyrinomonadaceae bacterium]|nr:BlaI/MecI/CopY family transcriptional regulator [Pyrinomonadaceae bacterium]